MRDRAMVEWAVLWDLDNFDPGTARTAPVALALGRLLGTGTRLFVAAHPRRLRRRAAVLRRCGFEVLNVTPGRNAADRRLLAVGAAVQRDGVRSFLVLSNDRAF